MDASRLERAARALLGVCDIVREIRGETYGWERDLATAADALRAALAADHVAEVKDGE